MHRATRTIWCGWGVSCGGRRVGCCGLAEGAGAGGGSRRRARGGRGGRGRRRGRCEGGAPCGPRVGTGPDEPPWDGKPLAGRRAAAPVTGSGDAVIPRQPVVHRSRPRSPRRPLTAPLSPHATETPSTGTPSAGRPSTGTPSAEPGPAPTATGAVSDEPASGPASDRTTPPEAHEAPAHGSRAADPTVAATVAAPAATPTARSPPESTPGAQLQTGARAFPDDLATTPTHHTPPVPRLLLPRPPGHHDPPLPRDGTTRRHPVRHNGHQPRHPLAHRLRHAPSGGVLRTRTRTRCLHRHCGRPRVAGGRPGGHAKGGTRLGAAAVPLGGGPPRSGPGGTGRHNGACRRPRPGHLRRPGRRSRRPDHRGVRLGRPTATDHVRTGAANRPQG